jgi:aspartate aminotransferase-like enzyme
MKSSPALKFKEASEQWEHEAIHQLLYRTFVEEIPQYQANPNRKLVDKFDDDNRYLICLDGRTLAGVITLRSKRPFSLDQKLANLDEFLPKNKSISEVRLLTVHPDYRHRTVLPGLLKLLEKQALAQGCDIAIMSASVTQLKLYRHMGCVPFGPLTGAPGAQFQPMMLAYETYKSKTDIVLGGWRERIRREKTVNLLPGPVTIHPSVRRAFSKVPVSHRSRDFRLDFQQLRKSLCALVGAARVEIMLGSGTLANDAIGGQISLLGNPGLVLANGEFGERLIDQARRFGLRFEMVRKEWGEAFSEREIRDQLAQLPDAGWIWAVHCETSTSVLNDMEMLAGICSEYNLKLCLDCVSSIGVLPVNLGKAYLASAVSGKGFGSLAGLAMVFYHHDLSPAPNRLPRYLDLGYYAQQDGIPFTHSSNLTHALQTAVQRMTHRDFGKKAELSSWLKEQLEHQGFKIIASGLPTSPAVITFALRDPGSSESIGRKLEEEGFQLSYRSEYLRRRNWIQICLMGECRRTDLQRLLRTLVEVTGPAGTAAGADSTDQEHLQLR